MGLYCECGVCLTRPAREDRATALFASVRGVECAPSFTLASVNLGSASAPYSPVKMAYFGNLVKWQVDHFMSKLFVFNASFLVLSPVDYESGFPGGEGCCNR